MKNFKEKLIGVESRTELDLEHPHYDGEEANRVEVPRNEISFTGAPSMDIDDAIKILNSLKERGANRVYIADHEDHYGYYFYGVKLQEI